ncbi:hypothetical protein HID58_028820 [Brassica napus]|uniref:Uncharacterized protein n=1 Tax=Brassica napus TaxID=3708 RepID=A0ABQ8CBA6_BRANA|nr:hypothetical protein HID58_036046 [Brassica napus]KAH0914374.1 hypothetical protein HID58_028820 [Brassica napus]
MAEVKEVREKVEVKKETQLHLTNMLMVCRMCLILALVEVFFQDHVHFVAMHAVTGSYARPNFVDYLGAKPDSISNGVPLEDGHPDPNLT